ncbi:MAG TPA: tail fiber protein [Allosphingosinicella sp.]|nr:tail fiber protein [Allosphingosinicella sp.]
MAQPYVGEIRIFAGNFAPSGWMFCEGQLLPISENETLFQLIGTTYGGDGQSTFALPDCRGRVLLHQGTGGGQTYTLAQTGGVESVTLTTQQIPVHSHAFLATTDQGTQANAQNANLASLSQVSVYRPNATPVGNAMSNQAITPTGGSQPHDNMHPYLCLDYIISLFGLFPSPT